MLKRIWYKIWPPLYIIQYKGAISDESYRRLKDSVNNTEMEGRAILLEDCSVRKI